MKILFFDAETVPQTKSFDELPEEAQKLWTDIATRKLGYENATPEEISEAYWERGALYAEFGKIVCISIGAYHEGQFLTKSFAGDDEVQIITDFFDTITRKYSSGASFCGHNIKGFDVKFICRRAIMLGIKIPPIFNPIGKKPYEVPFLDTMEMWKFGDYRDFTSLKLLCHALGVKTPKDDIDGSQVKEVYYTDKNINRIITYCEKDVVAEKECYEKLVQLGL